MIAWLSTAAVAADLCLLAASVHPVSQPPIEDGVVVVRGETIVAIGPASSMTLPDDCETYEAAILTPGIVDGLSTAGLTGLYNDIQDQDHREVANPIQPALRAIDGFDPWEELVGYVRAHGVTTMRVAPSPGPVVAGRAAIVSTPPFPEGAAAERADEAMVVSFGEPPKYEFDKGFGVHTRMGTAAAFRQALADAAEYARRRRLKLGDRPPVDLGLEALAEVIGGQRRVVVYAHRADDLLSALRIGFEYDLSITLAGAAEAYLVREAIAQAGVPVLVGPVMLRSWSDGERTNASFRNAAYLVEAGVQVGFMSGFEAYVPKVRVVLWEAAIAAAHGLGRERALEALTLDGARILGVDGDRGSIEVGKRADLVLFDGDPFEYASHVTHVVVAGQTYPGE